jgi:hypothetical protein
VARVLANRMLLPLVLASAGPIAMVWRWPAVSSVRSSAHPPVLVSWRVQAEP